MRIHFQLTMGWILALSLGQLSFADPNATPATPASPAAVAPAAAESAAASATAAQAKPVVSEAVAAESADLDRVVCKKITETGTLGRKKKVCMTAGQWQEQRDAARSTMRRIENSAGAQNSGVPGG